MPSISVRAPGDESIHAREETEMFVLHDIVDLLALFGAVRLGRVVWKIRHKSHS
jgi:hypothetical protein